jgi:uncharacterized membrane protein YvbJ
MATKMKPGQKRCPNCGVAVNGPRTKTCPKCGHGFNGKPQAAVVAAAPAAPTVVEKPTNGGTVTLEQIKKVAQTVKTLGGYQRATEVLAVIKEMGGVKKFKDLAEAMTVSGTEATTVTSTDDIPY